MLMRFFRALMPREERFIDCFIAQSGHIVAAADALAALMAAEERDAATHAARLGTIEKEADTVTRQTVLALHRAFLTPFDRSDILSLINAMDDTVDLMEEVAQGAALYGVRRYSPAMRDLAGMSQTAARLIAELTPLLTDISGNAERISGLCEQISRIESGADAVLHTALSELIAEKPEMIDFLGRKEVLELLEAVTDRCDDVADIIEGILLDHV